LFAVGINNVEGVMLYRLVYPLSTPGKGKENRKTKEWY
jgi:hypothetical protein